MTVRIGGQRIDRPGWFYAPTVVTDADQSDEIVQREVFGQVITIQRGHSEPISSFLRPGQAAVGSSPDWTVTSKSRRPAIRAGKPTSGIRLQPGK